jgi:hypothetical protein
VQVTRPSVTLRAYVLFGDAGPGHPHVENRQAYSRLNGASNESQEERKSVPSRVPTHGVCARMSLELCKSLGVDDGIDTLASGNEDLRNSITGCARHILTAWEG